MSHNAARIINFKTGAVCYFVSEPLHNFNIFFFHFLSYMYLSKTQDFFFYILVSNLQGIKNVVNTFKSICSDYQIK